MNNKKFIQLLRNRDLELNQLKEFIISEERNFVYFINEIELMDKLNFEFVMSLVLSLEEELRLSVYKKLLASNNLFYPFKEHIIRELKEERKADFLIDIANTIDLAEKEHFTFKRGLIEKALSDEYMKKFAEKPSQIILLYLRKYIKKDFLNLRWIYDYYGKWNNLDKALMKLIEDLSIEDAQKIYESMPKEKLSKGKIKEFKKSLHLVEQKGLKDKNFSKRDGPFAIALKAWIGPVAKANRFQVWILNFLKSTEDHILFSILFRGNKILASEIFQRSKDGIEKICKNSKLDGESFFIECNPAYVINLLKLYIKKHEKRNKKLPENLNKYKIAAMAQVDTNERYPMQELFKWRGNKLRLFIESDDDVFRQNIIFSTWLMPMSVIEKIHKKIDEAKKTRLLIAGETEERANQKIIEGYLREYWTASRRKMFALFLMHMSYYFYLFKMEKLSILCYYWARQLKNLNYDIANSKFALLFFNYSYEYYRQYIDGKLKGTLIISPNDKKLIY